MDVDSSVRHGRLPDRPGRRFLTQIKAAAPEDTCFSPITSLAGKLVGHPSIPLVVVTGNPTGARVENMT